MYYKFALPSMFLRKHNNCWDYIHWKRLQCNMLTFHIRCTEEVRMHGWAYKAYCFYTNDQGFGYLINVAKCSYKTYKNVHKQHISFAFPMISA